MEEIKKILKNWRIAQKAGAILPCPRCGLMKMNPSNNALSRRTNIDICNSCGTAENVEDMSAYKTRPALEVGSDEYKESFIKEWWIANDMLGRQQYKPTATGDYEIMCKRKVVLTGEDIDDIMSAAFDGGITYWCDTVEVIGEYYGEFASEQISRGGSVRLFDKEDKTPYILTLEKFLNGFAAAYANGFCTDIFDGDGNTTLDVDAEEADAIIQYALFGELVYG